VSTRALVVAAPASGSGKTTVATGLMAALGRRGTAVAPFKVGPDYIDPGYHTLAAGRPGRNLDPVLVGEHRIAPLFRHGAAGAEVAVVEGVMGLFDGRLADGHGSTAHVAGLLGAPVVLVVDCRGQSRSVAALLHGFRSFDPATRVAGVVLNRVGSERHAAVLRAACDEVGLPVLGALPRRAELAVPSRHLGLVTAAEHGAAAMAAVEAMAELVAAHVDLEAVVRLAEPIAPGPAWDPAAELAAAAPDSAAAPDVLKAAFAALNAPEAAFSTSARVARPVVAIAGGAAFTFGYAEHTELLSAAGLEVAVVDPLHDERLPDGTAALVLPGGFPEEHVAALSANVPLRAAVADLAASGAPVHAECGGLLYLCADLDGHPLAAALPATAAMTGRLTLGYREAVALADSAPFAAGQRVTGHEFHHCAVTPRAGAAPAWGWRGAEPEGFVDGGVHASFLHTHPAGAPAAVARFARAAARSTSPIVRELSRPQQPQ
jgi:cobyrinic acid a,c-diamide synthase